MRFDPPHRVSFRLPWRLLGALVLAPSCWVLRANAQVAANPHESDVGECTMCHREDAWRPVKIAQGFRHAEQHFPLDGAHKTAVCVACHRSLVFSEAPVQCGACHEDVHRGELGVNCSRCHTTRSFVDRARLIQRHDETRFPLRGVHIGVPCESCHPGTPAGQAQYAGRPSSCVSCHRSEYARTTAPSHASAGFSTDCAGCHSRSAVTWQGATFNHGATGFPLTGAHLALACPVCHGTGAFTPKPTTCVSCHQAQYLSTSTPPHAPAGLSTDCTTCHNTTTWLATSWTHASTGWPLTGLHITIPCASCHGDRVYHGKSTLCYSCHAADYTATTNPNHRAGGFPTICESCHTTTNWLGATFNHDANFFPIYSGNHRNRWTACTDCHLSSSNFAAFSCTTGCHSQAATDPRHQGRSGYQYLSSACYRCHPRGNAG